MPSQIFDGALFSLDYALKEDLLEINEVRFHEEAYFSQGSHGLRSDFQSFIDYVNPPLDGAEIVWRQVPYIQWNVAIELGFRPHPDRHLMKYIPDAPPGAVLFPAIRPGCFSAGGMVRMKDGTRKPVRDLDVADHVAHGGVVTAIIRTNIAVWHVADGAPVGGLNATFEEGRWQRVFEMKLFKELEHPDGMEGFFIDTEKHLIEVDGKLFTDTWETEEALRRRLSMSDDIVEILNSSGG